MIVCIDVGNSNTTVGVLEGTKVRGFWRIMTHERTADEYGLMASSLLQPMLKQGVTLNLGGVCSVVPSETSQVIGGISRGLNLEVRNVDGAATCGIRILTDSPGEVGADRISNAAGAFYEYGGPAIVVDMGTATTFDFISREGEYRGGIIAPGIITGARELWQRARMLPAVELRRPSKLIGTTTIGCMQSGIFYGSISQVEGIVERMWEDLGEACTVIVTGGQAELICAGLRFEAKSDPYLTLKGIAYVVDPSLRSGRGTG
jgi:type III pantothenate kinase